MMTFIPSTLYVPLRATRLLNSATRSSSVGAGPAAALRFSPRYNDIICPPRVSKVNPADQPIIQFSLSSSTVPISKVDDYAEVTLAQQISQLSGVAQVLVYGAQKFAVRVQVDPVAAAMRGISLEDVRTVLAKTNSNTPVGTICGVNATQNTTLDASAAMRAAAEYRNIIAAYRNGIPVRLREIANVLEDVHQAGGHDLHRDQ
jgi:hydrophobic/amphiphilic exporter-1 (mainly G- bacteria), HAE1 family